MHAQDGQYVNETVYESDQRNSDFDYLDRFHDFPRANYRINGEILHRYPKVVMLHEEVLHN